MVNNQNLNNAARVKNDEFYTQLKDIQRELYYYWLYDENFLRDKTLLLPCDDPEWSNFTKFFAQNFTRYGLKKLISTSYAVENKKSGFKPMRDLFDDTDAVNTPRNFARGKVLILERGKINDKPFEYLEGDGDFRSEEIKRFRDEADVIITNPPFSLFREFFTWILSAGKKFLVIGNMNAITYKEVFPFIKNNDVWLGTTSFSNEMVFGVPEDFDVREPYRQRAAQLGFWGNYTRIGNSCWLTNLEHGKRHEPLKLMTLEENLLNSKHKEIRDVGYLKYDNCDAIEVPYVDAIPSDYEGVMGVPITFLNKYCPNQFEIIGKIDTDIRNKYTLARPIVKGKRKFKRIAIRFRS